MIDKKDKKAAAADKSQKVGFVGKIVKKLKLYLCPALLGAVICFAVVYALYRPFSVPYAVIFLAAELMLFSLFDRLKEKKIAGGLIYTLMLVLTVAISLTFIRQGWFSGEGDLISWFYGEDGNYSLSPFYLNAVFVGGGFFVISILYYFTQVRYRSLGVMLSILFPFVIYAKRAEEIPEILVTIIITLYLTVMVHNRRLDPALSPQQRGRLVINRSYILSAAIFVSVTGAAVMLIEKPEYQSQLERDSNYFNYVQTGGTGAGGYEQMSQTSSQRYGGGAGSNRILFYFETNGSEDIYFLRRQAYDYFDGDVWHLSDGYEEDYGRVFSLDNPEVMYDDILTAMESLADSGVDLGAAEPSAELAARVQGRAYDDAFCPSYLPAPLGVIADELTLPQINATSHRKYNHGEVLRNTRRYYSNEGIDDRFEFLEQSLSLYEYAAALNLSGEEYEKLLQIGVGGSLIDTNIYIDYYAVLNRYTDQSFVSQEVAQLAQEITADCHSDYEKALALEQYFAGNGFVYDLEYVPEDTSIEYFLFEGKTGVCSSYATAMTLMARAVGLPSRYVEGFAAFEKNDDGDFVIRDSYAHAFVEVYIPGAGWLTFDPTIADYRQLEASGFDMNTFISILARLLIVIAVAFVIIFILLLDRILERIFRIRLAFKSPRDKVLALYANLIKLLSFSTGSDCSVFTVNEVRRHLYDTRSVSLDSLLTLFEKTCFGGYQPTAEEFAEVYREYKRCYRVLRKIPSKKKDGKRQEARS